MNQSQLLWGVLYGSIGLGLFLYGRKQKVLMPYFCGLALMVFPYFVSNTLALVAVGAVLTGLPYFIRF